MIHMTCKRTKTAKEDLAFIVEKFLGLEALKPNVLRYPTDMHTQTCDKTLHQEDDTNVKDQSPENLKPRVLWSLYLNLPASDIQLKDSAPKNIHLCSGPDLELDYDFAVNQVSLHRL